jgi:hypothetical protein
LLAQAPAGALVNADYDTDRLRRLIEARGGALNISPKTNRI